MIDAGDILGTIVAGTVAVAGIRAIQGPEKKRRKKKGKKRDVLGLGPIVNTPSNILGFDKL